MLHLSGVNIVSLELHSLRETLVGPIHPRPVLVNLKSLTLDFPLHGLYVVAKKNSD